MGLKNIGWIAKLTGKKKTFRPTDMHNTITVGGGTGGTYGTGGHDLDYRPLPLIGQLPLKVQYTIGVVFLGLNIILAGLTMSFYYSGLTSVSGAINNAAQSQTEIQRAAKMVKLTLNGEVEQVDRLKTAQDTLRRSFDRIKTTANDFDEHQAYHLNKMVSQSSHLWEKVDMNISAVLANEDVAKKFIANKKAANAASVALRTRLTQSYTLMGQLDADPQDLQTVLSLLARGAAVARIERLLLEFLSATSYQEGITKQILAEEAVLKKTIETLTQKFAEQKKNDSKFGVIEGKLVAAGGEAQKFAELNKNLFESFKGLLPLFVAEKGLDTSADIIGDQLALIIDDYSKKLLQVNLRASTAAFFGLLGLLSFLLVVLINVKETQRQALETKREQQATQNAIMRLLDEMGSLADGDLTVRATVSEEITGAIADSVNFAITQLADLVSQIQFASNEIDKATAKATGISTRLLGISHQQSKDISETGQAVLRIAESIDQVSQQMTESQRVAEQSVDSSNKGMLAVGDSIAGIRSIQDNVEETAKRIRRLTDQSKQISEIVDLIADISEKTSVLAINATVQATKAGAAGKGFKVVADAVNDLAHQASDASRRIGALINAIQTDIQGAGQAMEKTSDEALKGARMAEATGEVFAEIGDVSMALAELVSEMNQTVAGAAKEAASVSSTMKTVLDSVSEASDATKSTTSAIEEINQLSERLRDSVSGFKV